MTATKQETESDLIGDLTDKAIENEINRFSRMVSTRRDRRDDLDDEIKDIDAKIDALLDEQIKRLSAKKRVVVKAAEEDGDEQA